MTRPTRKHRFEPATRLESLEHRQLMATANPVEPYNPSPFVRRIEQSFPTVRAARSFAGLRQLSFLDNDGKVFTGTLRDGTTWSLTVHGPGVAIITDTSPNDGELNDPIDTIQLVGTSLDTTYVTGQTSASPRVLTSGQLGFNRLLANEGVASIILNGFVLRETGPSPSGPPSIALLGGVRTLAFDGIEVNVDFGADETGATVLIGDPTTPLTVAPDIRIGSILNTAFDGGELLNDQVPQTTPTVTLTVNGEIRDLELISATAQPASPIINATLSPVAYTGRTSVRTFGIRGLKVVGSARNFTVSRTTQPFTSQFSGIDRIGHAYFGGNADAVALDVSNGEIGRLKFLRGLGNPDGTQTTALSQAGTPLGLRGYPASGLSGGVVAARRIRAQGFGPANLILQHRLDPKLKQLRTSQYVDYLARPGNALTNATIATSDSMGDTTIVGNSKNSLIAAGYDYQASVQGLDPVRQPSRIRRFRQRGDLIDSVVASSYRAVDGQYGNDNDLAGNGTIEGNLDGALYQATPSTGQGVGFFARRLIGRLPSVGGPQAEAPKRFRSVLYRV